MNLTIEEAAQKSRMSVAWWRKMIFEKKVRYLKIGARVFVPESTLDELFRAGVVEPGNRAQ